VERLRRQEEDGEDLFSVGKFLRNLKINVITTILLKVNLM
jgi:hypothetical protein